ncbi:MAG: hypothetical protein ACI8T1_002942 [Verrucomicrobiales bacterium]
MENSVGSCIAESRFRDLFLHIFTMAQMKTWITTARIRPLQISSLKIGCIVGTILNLINQGPAILAGDWESVSLTKLLLTYCVPYCVAIYAGTNARRCNK